MPVAFKGNCPRNVNRDAKYSVRRHAGDWAVALTFETGEDEIVTLYNTEHPELVEKVNQIKRETGNQEGGAFYINEYHQILVPVVAGDGSRYYLGGIYFSPLDYEHDDDRRGLPQPDPL